MTDKKPDFFSKQDEVKSLLKNKSIILFLDYDGTLTPIVDTPDKAIISEDMRAVVTKAADTHTTAIVSGRATDDVRSKVKIDGIYYAGSHGFEIVDPQGNVQLNPQAEKIREKVKAIHARLSEQLKPVKGALVEDVKYTISVHYRLVADEDFGQVEQAVAAILAQHPDFRRTSGKKVFEIRPDIDWDKGKAVEWILDKLNFHPDTQTAIYIGDDTTDEDAFAVLQGRGFGIVVTDHPKESLAQYQVGDTRDVRKVLEFLST